MLMLRLRAPAKLNLFLRVLGKRPDGYHEIETLFERVDLADELAFEPHPSTISLTCNDPALPVDETNLVLKAAQLLRSRHRVPAGAAIHLTKRIPMAAGLGGGSSDAAAALRGLAELWQLPLTRKDLEPLAAELGSDVPFFLASSPFAVGRGRGERCEPLALDARLVHVLVVPRQRLSTREVYGGLSVRGEGLTAPAPSINILEHALSNGSLSELACGLRNDLEPEAIRRCPIIATILSELRQTGCPGVRMSGSGSAVFGLCIDLAHAEEVAMCLRHSDPDRQIEILQTDVLHD